MNHDDAPTARHETVLDAGSRRVSRVYAEALLDAAQKRDQLPQVLEEFTSLLDDLFRADPQFEAFLASGAISRKPKAEVIHRAFDGRASDTFRNFLLVLNDHQRLELLRGIYEAVRELYDERSGRMRVVVNSAVPLPDDQRERLLHELREKYRKEPVLTIRVDPALLGGLVIRVGDWLYDGSVRMRLDNIRKQLIERGSHATV
ncbi:MAG TPA: ATP synthase F1 subunit delta [Gemmataceae bacterium]|nr:ATP synthase F1 subunit delta [Gemmataceae bacterium]